MRTVRVVYRNGRFEPLEEVNLPDGVELLITIKEERARPPEERFKAAAGSWKGLVDAEALKRNIYRSRLIQRKGR